MTISLYEVSVPSYLQTLTAAHAFMKKGREFCVGEGLAEGDIERTREDGKTSSVHFLHFHLTSEQIAGFRDPAVAVRIGCDHPRYAHLAILSAETRAELAKDLA